MLNLNVEVNINAKFPKIPIKLKGVNQCLHCGATDSLEKVNIFGKVTKQEIYPLDHIKCNKCGYDYSIQWEDNGKGELIPVPVSPSLKQEAINTMGYFKIRKNGNPKI